MSAWQPIETAPKDGSEVLVWAIQFRSPFRNRHRPLVGFFDGSGWCMHTGNGAVAPVVGAEYWQPIDPPPDASPRPYDGPVA